MKLPVAGFCTPQMVLALQKNIFKLFNMPLEIPVWCLAENSLRLMGKWIVLKP